MARKRKSISYKTLYKNLIDDMIERLYAIEYDHDNRVEAVWRQDIELGIRKLKKKSNQINL